MSKSRIMPQLRIENDVTDNNLVRKPMFAGLVILYVEDNGKTLNYITKERLKELGFNADELHKAALKNLNEDINTITGYHVLDHDDGTKAITYETEDAYDASRLLLLFYLKLELFIETLGDPFCVAIPHRDFLIAVPESYKDKLSLYSKEQFGKNKNKLLPEVFMFSKKKEAFE